MHRGLTLGVVCAAFVAVWILPARANDAPVLKPAVVVQSKIAPQHYRKDVRSAYRMARYHWLDKAAAADPDLIASICCYSGPAKILAAHPRLASIAEQDHYVCRRITKFKSAARILARNPEALGVVGHDPEGIYQAIRRDRKIAYILAKNPQFDQMIVDNPDLGKFISAYM